MSSILLKNGTVLIHDDHEHVRPTNTDILIRGNTIIRIGKDLIVDDHDEGIEIIDCTDKIISPGFVDTHHHMWQMQLKGRHANHLLLQYMPTGNWQASNFTDSDVYWGQLGGCLEATWAGTTTVVDHAHMNYTPNSSRLAISATVSSGLRSVFGYCPDARIKSWNPVQFHDGIFEPWVMETLDALAKEAAFGDGRVTLGLAFDLYFLPPGVVKDVFERAKALGVRTITSHMARSPMMADSSKPQMLKDLGLLDETMLFSHASYCSAEEARLIRQAGAHISSTPSTELQMAQGAPECWRDDLRSHASLGIDCHSANLGSIASEMRIGLQAARAMSNAKFHAAGKSPKNVSRTVEDAFNLATIQGARAVRMEDKIGSIKEGKIADLIIFGTSSPGMVCAADHDPIAAVVLHSCPSDIEAVMIDGIWRKRAGALLPVQIEKEAQMITDREQVEWDDVVSALRESRRVLQQKIVGLDIGQAEQLLYQMWGIDSSKIVDRV